MTKKWHIANKMERQQALAGSGSLTPHLILTKPLSGKTLKSFLMKYKTVFLKPMYGRGGKGIVRVKKVGTRYSLHSGTKSKTLRGRRRLLKAVERMTGGKPYLIQRGIRLLTKKSKSQYKNR